MGSLNAKVCETLPLAGAFLWKGMPSKMLNLTNLLSWVCYFANPIIKGIFLKIELVSNLVGGGYTRFRFLMGFYVGLLDLSSGFDLADGVLFVMSDQLGGGLTKKTNYSVFGSCLNFWMESLKIFNLDFSKVSVGSISQMRCHL